MILQRCNSFVTFQVKDRQPYLEYIICKVYTKKILTHYHITGDKGTACFFSNFTSSIRGFFRSCMECGMNVIGNNEDSTTPAYPTTSQPPSFNLFPVNQYTTINSLYDIRRF